MKKLFAALLALALMLTSAVLAEPSTYSELEGMSKEELVTLAAELLGIEKEAPAAEGASDTPTDFVALAKGDKGDRVIALQKRLIELNYLSGSADGDYGKGTAGAVSAFQAQNGLDATGSADVATQKLLFSDKAEKAIVYEKLDYKADSRDPDQFEGRYVKFDGKVLQVIEDGNLLGFRIATKGNWDDVVFVLMTKPSNYSRILEDDKVTVVGKYSGLYSYETVRGDTLTIPEVYASAVTLK